MPDVSARTPLLLLTATLAACSSTESAPPDAAGLRPGVVDSNQSYQGTPSENERAFWVAVRTADDAARDAAVARLKADIAADPTNGYSQFLVAASHFMAPSSSLRALAAGTTPPGFQPPPSIPYLKEALLHLTDPFYLGFDGGLLASVELGSGNVADGGPRFATAMTQNPIATALIVVLGDLAMRDPTKALADMYALVDVCNRGAIDRQGRDAARLVTKLNAGDLAQRECYSGYHAPHGSSGLLLILADLHALHGDTDAARAYYDALPSVRDYATWPLRPLAERRRAGTLAPDLASVDALTNLCGTCHTDTLP